MDGAFLEFTAIRGIQAGTSYYVIMVPLKSVPQLFKFNDECMPADLRAQRVLNRSRVPEIASYIVENSSEYILSSLCASVDGELEFQPAAQDGPLRKVGQLRVDLGATILINDGQHRRAAIEEAIRERPSLENETISVVIFADRGLKRAQQMFADLNIHAVRPTKSLKLLYDHRDALAGLTRTVVKAVPLFRDFTCYDRTSIPSKSRKLFTLSALHQATAVLIGKAKGGVIDEDDEALATRFWNSVIIEMPDWVAVGEKRAASSELRRDYVHAHGVAVQAIGAAGAQLVRAHPDNWQEMLPALRNVDWSRANLDLWESRALAMGKVNKGKNNVVLVTNVIVRALGLPLGPEAQRIEDLYARPTTPKLKAAI
jgi:DNA sulfur modification protein DndB